MSAESTRHPMTGNEMSGASEGGMERHQYDVVVVGAGGAGLRAATISFLRKASTPRWKSDTLRRAR